MTRIEPAGVAHNARPYLYGDEPAAPTRALRTGVHNHSAVTDEFETAVARFLGMEDTVATAAGTPPLHIALLAAGVGPGAEVLVPSFTFCATVQAVVATGARPRFVEVDPRTGCVDSAIVLNALTPDTRAVLPVLPVLYGGRPVDLSDAMPVLDERGITVVEDAAHAFGSQHGARRVGATGRLTCFSFGPVKNLTCGLGGMVVPRNPAEAETCRRLRGLGIAQSAAWRAEATAYTVETFGTRAQMSSLNAAIGLARLPHFPRAERIRKALWLAYAALRDMDGVALVDVDIEHAVPHLCAVRVPTGWNAVFRTLRQRGIGVGTHYPPNHPQPAFHPWYRPLASTERTGREILTLPFHQHLAERDIERVAVELRRAITTAGADR
ncbi:DegT/DnrJ/EryC1/StrS family aminotransferase [Streptomyces marincola]|uniref:DegT/DnrJ/EryC1/StrS family aminotransferase n=1 Tax=Streptomyces marincola TaxID=2878388 RepID=UPI001CF51974|nr:DegT/DnrJ/EryC1/StrS family aminotransferase [Streptomyces marincola]UCM89739.1 DegT/DnrJ/EryC1/StrS family aminotransferase [Streptomyces marincola]